MKSTLSNTEEPLAPNLFTHTHIQKKMKIDNLSKKKLSKIEKKR